MKKTAHNIETKQPTFLGFWGDFLACLTRDLWASTASE